MASFFSLLRYSFGNEDWKTEETALNIQPQDEVLCITASGDRPLNLLTRQCQKMTCIDANPVQNYLLELKAAAMAALEYRQYVAFLGAAPCLNRKELFKLVMPHLPPLTAQYWKEHEKMIERGIIYQGTVERLTSLVAKAFSILRGTKVKKLFAMNDLEEQKQFIRDEWDSYAWRKIFKVLLNPLISRFIIKDPGLLNVGSDIKVGTYIYDRIHESLERDLAKNNPLLSLIIKGKVSQDAFSPHLTEAGTAVIRHRLGSLKVHTSNVIDYLDSIPGPAFDVFSLSDIASYMSYPHFVRLLTLMIKTAKPGARFCMRQFLSCYEIPSHLKSHFRQNKALEKRLEKQDNCFVYRFMVGTIGVKARSSKNAFLKNKHTLLKKSSSIAEVARIGI